MIAWDFVSSFRLDLPIIFPPSFFVTFQNRTSALFFFYSILSLFWHYLLPQERLGWWTRQQDRPGKFR